ncbi:MAG: S8 family serine peptidase [Thiobacillus sp.]
MPSQQTFPVQFSDNRRCYRSGSVPGFTLSLLLVSVLSAYASLSEAAPAPAAAVEKVKPYLGWARGRLLVAPRAGLTAGEFDKALLKQRGRKKAFIQRLNAHVVELPSGADEVAAMNELRKNRKFKYVELDVAVAHAGSVTDPAFGNSWALPKIGATSAWDQANGTGVTIAILDTGVDATHPDLAANMVPGWNVYDNTADTADVHGHGTTVAGTAAAVANNAAGSAGVAYGAKIMPIRISSPDGYAYWSTVANGIYWAADHGAKVANISFNGISGSATVQSAADYMRSKGGVVVVAAGNSGAEEAIAAHNSLMTVSATDSSDARAGFSSYGAYVDIAAPGVGIYTTTRGGGYGNASGTSFSSPVVAATAALMLSANKTLPPSEIDRILKSTALDLGTAGADVYFGSGRVNAVAAVNAAKALAGSDTQSPTVAITAPTGGRINAIVPIDMTYSDNVGVARIELYANSTKIITDTAGPFAFAWDTATVADGSYTLTVRAYDVAGNQSTSAPVSVTVANDTIAPVISSFNLTEGMKMSNPQAISASATDNQSVAKMSLTINGKEMAIAYGSSISYTLSTSTRTNRNRSRISKSSTTTTAPTSYSIVVKATDKAGNTASKSATVYQ